MIYILCTQYLCVCVRKDSPPCPYLAWKIKFSKILICLKKEYWVIPVILQLILSCWNSLNLMAYGWSSSLCPREMWFPPYFYGSLVISMGPLNISPYVYCSKQDESGCAVVTIYLTKRKFCCLPGFTVGQLGALFLITFTLEPRLTEQPPPKWFWLLQQREEVSQRMHWVLKLQTLKASWLATPYFK